MPFLRERVFVSLCMCTLALSQSPTQTATRSARPTTISSTRFTIDTFNRIYTIQSDAALVSAGCRDVFSDNRGSLISTAVLIRSPVGQPGDPEWTYRPSRVDILLYIPPGQSRTAVNDLVMTLYEDDGSTARFPGAQLAAPYSLSTRIPNVVFTNASASWVQVDVSGAGWPLLEAGAYYWIALSAGQAITLGSASNYNGVIWSGLNETGSPLPSSTTLDPALFTARQLSSERFFNDAPFACNPTNFAAANLGQATSNWASVANASVRLRNWQVSGSSIRYGIQVIGWQSPPSTTASITASQTLSQSRSASQGRTPSQSRSPTQSQTRSQTQSASQGRTRSRSATGTHSPSMTQTQSVTPTLTRSQSKTVTQTGSLSRSSSQASSGSRTPTQTVTTGLTPTATPSQTLSQLSTVTQSSTRTPSNTQTPSPSQMQSPTQTVSRTQTQSPSQGATGSTTATSSSSGSPSASPSQSESQSQTQSSSQSATGSATASASTSGSPSVSPSQSESGTQTQSPSESATGSATATSSSSGTPSVSPTQLASSSQSPTQSVSTGLTPTMTPSQTRTGTQSTTPSSTATMTPSSSSTQSATQTSSVTPTQSSTVSSTQTHTVSQTATPSATGTGSHTGTSTPSQTGSQAPTQSQTRSPTSTSSPSQAPSSSLSQTLTSSATQTCTQSVTTGLTPSVTPTQTASSTGTRSSTGSLTASGTRTPTTTGTQSQSVSSSPSQTQSATMSASRTPTLSLPPANGVLASIIYEVLINSTCADPSFLDALASAAGVNDASAAFVTSLLRVLYPPPDTPVLSVASISLICGGSSSPGPGDGARLRRLSGSSTIIVSVAAYASFPVGVAAPTAGEFATRFNAVFVNASSNADGSAAAANFSATALAALEISWAALSVAPLQLLVSTLIATVAESPSSTATLSMSASLSASASATGTGSPTPSQTPSPPPSTTQLRTPSQAATTTATPSQSSTPVPPPSDPRDVGCRATLSFNLTALPTAPEALGGDATALGLLVLPGVRDVLNVLNAYAYPPPRTPSLSINTITTAIVQLLPASSAAAAAPPLFRAAAAAVGLEVADSVPQPIAMLRVSCALTLRFPSYAPAADTLPAALLAAATTFAVSLGPNASDLLSGNSSAALAVLGASLGSGVSVTSPTLSDVSAQAAVAAQAGAGASSVSDTDLALWTPLVIGLITAGGLVVMCAAAALLACMLASRRKTKGKGAAPPKRFVDESAAAAAAPARMPRPAAAPWGGVPAVHADDDEQAPLAPAPAPTPAASGVRSGARPWPSLALMQSQSRPQAVDRGEGVGMGQASDEEGAGWGGHSALAASPAPASPQPQPRPRPLAGSLRLGPSLSGRATAAADRVPTDFYDSEPRVAHPHAVAPPPPLPLQQLNSRAVYPPASASGGISSRNAELLTAPQNGDFDDNGYDDESYDDTTACAPQAVVVQEPITSLRLQIGPGPAAQQGMPEPRPLPSHRYVYNY